MCRATARARSLRLLPVPKPSTLILKLRPRQPWLPAIWWCQLEPSQPDHRCHRCHRCHPASAPPPLVRPARALLLCRHRTELAHRVFRQLFRPDRQRPVRWHAPPRPCHPVASRFRLRPHPHAPVVLRSAAPPVVRVVLVGPVARLVLVGPVARVVLVGPVVRVARPVLVGPVLRSVLVGPVARLVLVGPVARAPCPTAVGVVPGVAVVCAKSYSPRRCPPTHRLMPLFPPAR